MGLPNKNEDLFSPFCDNQGYLQNNDKKNNVTKEYNFLHRTKFKSDTLFPLVNVNFEYEDDINLMNNDSSNTDEDDITNLHNN